MPCAKSEGKGRMMPWMLVGGLAKWEGEGLEEAGVEIMGT